jgi:hypothetical protein
MSDTGASSPETDPAGQSPGERDAPRGDAAWQAARRRVADRNARVRKLGMKERQEHESRIARYQRAAREPQI